MKVRMILYFICLALAMPLSGQVRVVDPDQLPPDQSFRFLPDVNGKVLVTDDWFQNNRALLPDDTVAVYPFWPLSFAGQNERGGIYCNLDADPDLEIVYTIGNRVYALNLNGQTVAGWPRTLDYPTDGAPAFGDINGDGIGEIVVTTHQEGSWNFGSVYAFKTNGTNVFGFPVALGGGALRTPVLADLDNNGSLEILLTVRDYPNGFIFAIKGDGTSFSGWPVRMDTIPGSTVAVGDITGDEIPEIIAESYISLHVYNTAGTPQPGFPYSPGAGRVFSYSTPVLADLDDDGLREIICGDHSTSQGNGKVHVVRSDGTSAPLWPKTTNYWIYGPPAIGDIDDDGILDIAVGDQVLSANPYNRIYAWNSQTGEPLSGFPITGIFAVNNQIILADLDEDYDLELVFDDNTSEGIYLGYNHDGTPMEDWPVSVKGSTFFINPFVADINNDGIIDMSGGGHDGETDMTFLYLWNINAEYHPERSVLPVLQYNTRHNGVYGDYLMVGMPSHDQTPGTGTTSLKIWPNPASDRINFSLFPDSRGTMIIRIHDQKGQLLLIRDFRAGTDGEFSGTIGLKGLPSGLYQFDAEINGGKYTEPFIIRGH